MLFCFTRSTDGALHAEENVLAKQTAKELLAKSQRKGRHYFDSADYALKLQGLLEYPLGEAPVPISFFFNRDRVGVVSHPDGTAMPPESVREMCEVSDLHNWAFWFFFVVLALVVHDIGIVCLLFSLVGKAADEALRQRYGEKLVIHINFISPFT